MMKAAYDEDKFGHDFIAGIDSRVAEMNATQLRGLYNHLRKTARGSSLEYWKNANLKVITHIEDLMKQKEEVVAKEAKKEEELYAAERAKARQKKMRAEANYNALEMIEKQARQGAEEDIRNAEKKRQVDERAEIFVKIIAAEVRKERVWKRTAAGYVVSVAGICVISLMFLQSLAAVLIGGGVALVTAVAGYIAFRYWRMAIVSPLVVTEQDLEAQIEKRCEELKIEGLADKARKDEQFKLAQAQEKVERKERKRKAQEKKAYEEKMMAMMAYAQAAALEEMSQSGLSIQDIMSGVGHSERDTSLLPTRSPSMFNAIAEMPLLDEMSFRFLGVEVKNTSIEKQEQVLGQQLKWTARITVNAPVSPVGSLTLEAALAFSWSAPCVKNDGLDLSFKEVLRSNKTSTVCRLVPGQLVRVEILAVNASDGSAAAASVIPPEKAEAKYRLEDNEGGDSSNNSSLGVFEAIQEDIVALHWNDREVDAEGMTKEETKDVEAEPGSLDGFTTATLRGVLLGTGYSRVADILVHIAFLPFEPDPEPESL